MRVPGSVSKLGLLLAVALACSASEARGAEPATSAAAPQASCPGFPRTQGGYQVSAAFSVDTERHAVISAPECLRAGDLLSIRPLRLNLDEYLVLQKCQPPDCAKAEVVRAWNSRGYMGPYPVLQDNIPIQDGVRYLLWMEHVPLPGSGSFSLIDRYGPPLVFKPVGRLTAFDYVQRALQAAKDRGPETVSKTAQEDSALVATFEGGSVVRMQALRPPR